MYIGHLNRFGHCVYTHTETLWITKQVIYYTHRQISFNSSTVVGKSSGYRERSHSSDKNGGQIPYAHNATKKKIEMLKFQ